MKFIGPITNIETFARGRGIREYSSLVTSFGGKNWLKKKGHAFVEVGEQKGQAEIHWYECDGIGKVKLKLKRWL